MKKFTAKQWFVFMAVAAFLSIVSFFQIDSAWADAHHFNGLFGWKGIGIITGLVAVFGLYKINQNSD